MPNDEGMMNPQKPGIEHSLFRFSDLFRDSSFGFRYLVSTSSMGMSTSKRAESEYKPQYFDGGGDFDMLIADDEIQRAGR
jgi:hypothetical protein